MANLDLRPLALGEILDRTFSIYRSNFLLFIGIAAGPQALMLLFNLAETSLFSAPTNPLATRTAPPTINGAMIGGAIAAMFVGGIVYFTAYIYSHGAAVNAVSDIYLGQTATIGGSYRKMRGHALNLLGVLILNGLAVFAGFFVFIIGAFYAMCRLCTTVPAAILEDKGPPDSLSRSWELTEDNAGRALAIIVLAMAISYALVMLFSMPFTILVFLAAYQKSFAMVRFWTVMNSLGTFIGGTLATPVLTIGTTVFYYDLRVRKEAFDLQMMMASVPAANPVPPSPPGLASPLP
jgi:hypothetical protein